MKKVSTALLLIFPVLAMIVGLALTSQPAFAQKTPDNPTAQQQPMQPDTQATAPETKTFTGKIVKTGDKLVLSDMASKTTYQLDDQQKAKDFVNKNVKVTGVLDSATGVIRVTVIDPA